MEQSYEIQFIPEAFIISNKKENYQIAWNDIIKIITYKIDLLTIDEICIDLHVNNGKIYTISEEIHNWSSFIKIMEKKCSIDEKWLGNVMLPPFVRNETILFESSRKHLSH